jgi:hypothetical protein
METLFWIWGSHSGGYEEFIGNIKPIILWTSTGVSEEYLASVFKVAELDKHETSIMYAASRALKMEEMRSLKTSIDFHWTTQLHIPEDRTHHNLFYIPSLLNLI